MTERKQSKERVSLSIYVLADDLENTPFHISKRVYLIQSISVSKFVRAERY